MNIKFIIGVFALAFVYSCTAKKAVAPAKDEVVVFVEPVKEKLVVTAETLAEGKSLYGMNCAKCHDLYNPKTFSAEEWTPIIMSMQKKAKISDEQREKIYAYLTTPQM